MSTPRVIAAASLAGVLSLVAAGCESREEYRTRLLSEGPDRKDAKVQQLLHPVGDKNDFENELAVRRVAEVRCSREARCENVGEGRRFADREACMNYVLDHSRVDLSSANCPGGIVEKELQECIETIEVQACGDPIDRMMRLVACRSSDMCKAIN